MSRGQVFPVSFAPKPGQPRKATEKKWVEGFQEITRWNTTREDRRERVEARETKVGETRRLFDIKVGAKYSTRRDGHGNSLVTLDSLSQLSALRLRTQTPRSDFCSTHNSC